MKQLLIFTFLALICIARSAPALSSTTRILILPDYEDEYEINSIDTESGEEITVPTTRRSTFITSTRTSDALSPRITWLLYRTSSIKTTEVNGNENCNQNGSENYFDDIRKAFKNMMEDLQKWLKTTAMYDFIQSIVRNFKKKFDN